jgi:hypothetical protein
MFGDRFYFSNIIRTRRKRYCRIISMKGISPLDLVSLLDIISPQDITSPLGLNLLVLADRFIIEALPILYFQIILVTLVWRNIPGRVEIGFVGFLVMDFLIVVVNVLENTLDALTVLEVVVPV